MQYSPKLKVAMEEIKEVLKKNDIAGFVVLHTPGFTEFLNHIEPSYSCAKPEKEGIRFRAKSAELGKEKVNQLAADTYNMIVHFADVIGLHAMIYIDAMKLLKEKLGGEEFRGRMTGEDDQNN